ncbi:MAG: ABC transporter substrate-binding protein [Planctomycetota bacterium]
MSEKQMIPIPAGLLAGLVLGSILIAASVFVSRSWGPRAEVVVYTALDPAYSRLVFAEFEQTTGIRVQAVFDTEATKTAGLVERLRRESAAPRCDVFWNNETLRTILLAREGHFEPYRAGSANDIPAEFREATGLWTGFAARARAVAFNPARVSSGDAPASHAALLNTRWRGQLAIANPQFGTTGSHFAMLFAGWGEARTRAWLVGLKTNEVRIVASNSATCERAVTGEALLGLTDTDDIEVVRRRGSSIAESLLAADGVVVLPNTVALLKGAPNPDAARRFIDFVLNPRVEALLAASPSRQIPVRASVPVPAGGLRLADIPRFAVSYEAAADALEPALRLARELWGL